MDAQKAHDAAVGAKDVFYVETDYDEIICDSCNAEIDTPTVLLVQFGRRVACAECYRRWYASEPVVWRRLRPDGTLGEEVPAPKEGD